MALLRNHLFLSICQLLGAAVIAIVYLASSSWQRGDLHGRISGPISMVFMLVLMALVGHYKLRKQVLVLAWGYSILLPLIIAVAMYCAFHVLN